MLPKDFYEDVKSKCIRESRNTENVFLSITIPTYKRSEFLDEAIESALNQDLENINLNYEVIVVNNDPEADMSYFIEKYKNVDNIAFYVNEKNIGMVGNMNRCAMLAKGKYVAYLHDDDLLKPNYIKEISKVLFNDKYNDAICITVGRDELHQEQRDEKPKRSLYRRLIKAAGQRIKNCLINLVFSFRYLYLKDGISSITQELSLRLFNNILYQAPTCGTVFNKEKFFAAGGWTSEGGMSFDFYSFLRFNGQFKIYRLEKSLGIYRFAVNESLLRSTKINFCCNDLALLNKKYSSERLNKYLKKYGKIIQYLKMKGFTPDEKKEICKILKIDMYTPPKWKTRLLRFKKCCTLKLHTLQ